MTTIVAKYSHWIPIPGKLFGYKSLHVPADLIVVCLWATSGLIATALVGTSGASADIAGILAVVE